jgi:hypothetical protein
MIFWFELPVYTNKVGLSVTFERRNNLGFQQLGSKDTVQPRYTRSLLIARPNSRKVGRVENANTTRS